MAIAHGTIQVLLFTCLQRSEPFKLEISDENCLLFLMKVVLKRNGRKLKSDIELFGHDATKWNCLSILTHFLRWWNDVNKMFALRSTVAKYHAENEILWIHLVKHTVCIYLINVLINGKLFGINGITATGKSPFEVSKYRSSCNNRTVTTSLLRRANLRWQFRSPN